MVEENSIQRVIKKICIATLGYADLRDEEDFFDRGASSLTIVDLQLQIETDLGVAVRTSDLMLEPSIAGWSRIYSAAQSQVPDASPPTVQS